MSYDPFTLVMCCKCSQPTICFEKITDPLEKVICRKCAAKPKTEELPEGHIAEVIPLFGGKHGNP